MTAVRLPDLPGCVRGIVAEEPHPDPRRCKLYTLQCERCYATEKPPALILMKFKFGHPRSADNPRLCPACYAACTCQECTDYPRWKMERTR
ncbi:hypothetical protein CQ010_01420 [Arthrobacter sp. MYb211]|nr:hypothetical protein CQ015_03675 [Arthrobacter sp. MYb221]PRC10531.1 hypothetical protein CQ010_01420 [Arthrobacter sp. MYb211]